MGKAGCWLAKVPSKRLLGEPSALELKDCVGASCRSWDPACQAHGGLDQDLAWKALVCDTLCLAAVFPVSNKGSSVDAEQKPKKKKPNHQTKKQHTKKNQKNPPNLSNLI